MAGIFPSEIHHHFHKRNKFTTNPAKTCGPFVVSWILLCTLRKTNSSPLKMDAFRKLLFLLGFGQFSGDMLFFLRAGTPFENKNEKAANEPPKKPAPTLRKNCKKTREIFVHPPPGKKQVVP